MTNALSIEHLTSVSMKHRMLGLQEQLRYTHQTSFIGYLSPNELEFD